MTSNNLHNMSSAEIRAELDQIVCDTAEWAKRAAVLLVELRRRRESHPLMYSDLLRHFKLIAEGKLDSAASMAAGQNRNLVRALARMPIEDQYDYVTTRTVQVVDRTPEGKETIEHRRITDLTQKTLDRVFGDKGLRSIEEQKAMMGPKPNRKRVGGVIVDQDEKALVISRKHYRPRDLSEPLRSLGYELRWVGPEGSEPA